MYLKRLEIQGFKSFARKTTLEFESGITAIVGPNGSGKSNIADCLRWVLGEQSTKLIRGKKSDDVIFAGSDKKVRAGFAEVVATFDNRDHKIAVDTSEVSIGRTISRSGESEYLLNGQKVRLLDIVDLVLKSNIGTSRYTVIGQGTIDQMVLSGPAEVKNLLDEASGVKTYYIRRDKTLRRLEQTAQNLIRAEDLLAEIEPRLKSLRRQAKRMEARSEIESELRGYQVKWYGHQHGQLSKHIGQHEATLSGLAVKRQELEEKLKQHRVDVEVHEKKGQEDVTRYSQIQQQLHSLQQQKNNLLENVSLVRGKMESHKTAGSGDPKTLQANAHTLEGKISELSKQLDKNLSDNLANQTELAKQQQTIALLTSQLDSLYVQLANPTVVDWEVFDVELLKFEKSFALFLETLSSASDFAVIRQSQQEISQTFQEFKSKTTTLIKTPQLQNSLHEQLQTLSKQKEALQSQLQSLQLEASKMTLEQEFLQQQIKDLQQQKLGVDLELQKVTAVDSDSYWQNLVTEESKLKTALDSLGLQIMEIEQSLKDYYQSETQFKNKISEKEKEYRTISDLFNAIKDQESTQQIEKAKQDAYMENLSAEITSALGLDALASISQHHTHTIDSDVEEKISKLKHQLELTGGVDELTIAEYHETESRFGNLQAQIEDLRKSMGDLREIMDELDEHIKSKFNEAFHNVNAKFEHYFRLLFNGGRAFLSIVKEQEKEELASSETDDETADQGEALRPEEKIVKKYEKGSMSVSGVDIRATPPGKKLSSIQALSGGERALTSIALLCSLLTCFPSPFVVLDEVDAALDESNTIRFGQILASLAHQTQFITITHNRETMANSNILYGVTMGDDGISKLLSIKLEAAKAFAK